MNNSDVRFSIDWLAYTLSYENFPAAKSYLLCPAGDVERYVSWVEMVSDAANIFDGAWVESVGLYSYEYGAEHVTGARVYWSGDLRMGIHVVFSGVALANVDAVELICLMWSLGARFTRIDICADEHGEVGKVSCVSDYVEAYRNGNFAGRRRQWKEITSSGGGHTLYVGSRQSERMLRLYDKGAEQGGVAGVWIRAEIELKGDAANGLAQHVGWNEGKQIDFAGLINSFIQFPDSSLWGALGDGIVELPRTKKGKRQTRAWGIRAIRTICKQIDLDSSYAHDIVAAFAEFGYAVQID